MTIQKESIETEIVEVTEFKRVPTESDWIFFGFVSMRKNKVGLNRSIIEFMDSNQNMSQTQETLEKRYRRLFSFWKQLQKKR
jgi:hypothetical protein